MQIKLKILFLYSMRLAKVSRDFSGESIRVLLINYDVTRQKISVVDGDAAPLRQPRQSGDVLKRYRFNARFRSTMGEENRHIKQSMFNNESLKRPLHFTCFIERKRSNTLEIVNQPVFF